MTVCRCPNNSFKDSPPMTCFSAMKPDLLTRETVVDLAKRAKELFTSSEDG